jgi:ribosome silencing factor RsfS/YbeB/iojap
MARRKKEKFFVSAKAALEKKAQDVVILDVKEMCSFADYFIICSGTSNRHVQGIATHIETRLKKEGFLPLGVEGLTEGAWILLYGTGQTQSKPKARENGTEGSDPYPVLSRPHLSPAVSHL